MTTRTDTKKFELLQSSPKVAVLMHDFPQVRADPNAAIATSMPPSQSPSSLSAQGSNSGGGGASDVENSGDGKDKALTLDGSPRGSINHRSTSNAPGSDSRQLTHTCSRQHLLHHIERRGPRPGGARGRALPGHSPAEEPGTTNKLLIHSTRLHVAEGSSLFHMKEI